MRTQVHHDKKSLCREGATWRIWQEQCQAQWGFVNQLILEKNKGEDTEVDKIVLQV